MTPEKIRIEREFRDYQDNYGHDGQEVPLGVWLQNNYSGDTFLKRRLSIIVKYALSLPQSSTYLEIGCGSGDAMSFVQSKIANQKSKVVYSDPSLSLMERFVPMTRNFFSLSGTEFRLMPFNAEKIPFQDNYFDLIIAKATVHHFDNPGAAFSEIYRVLKPGGIFYFCNDPQRGFLYNFGSEQKRASKKEQIKGVNCRVYRHRNYIAFGKLFEMNYQVDPSLESEILRVIRNKPKILNFLVFRLFQSDFGKLLLSRKMKLPIMYIAKKSRECEIC
jgi:ubiquinone/menaquinone biosynthesis C-methylase UbiE